MLLAVGEPARPDLAVAHVGLPGELAPVVSLEVELLKALHLLLEGLGEGDLELRVLVDGPASGGEDLDRELHTAIAAARALVGLVLPLVLGHDVLGGANVVEHALQLGRELRQREREIQSKLLSADISFCQE